MNDFRLRCLLLLSMFTLLNTACRDMVGSDLRAEASLPSMEYIDICEGETCRSFSRLIMGTDHLGKMPNEETVAVLDEAVRLGINAFDTAPIYVGGIEARLGAWLREQDRDDLYTISKGGFPFDLGPGTYSSRLKGSQEEIIANVEEEIETSFAQLNDDLTLYLMHRDDVDFQDYQQIERAQTPAKTILAALSDERISDKFTMLGLSNWTTDRVNESQAAAGDNSSLVRPVANSPYFSLMEMSDVTIHSGGIQVKHDEMTDPEFQPGVKIMPYSPLGGFNMVEPGWEDARQAALELKNSGDRYWRNVYDAIFHDANEERYSRALDFTEEFNEEHQSQYTLDQIMNAYALAHERTDFLIIGPLTVEQLRRTVGSLEVSRMLSQDDLDYLYGM